MNVSVRLRGIIAVFALAGASIAQNRVPGSYRISTFAGENPATDMYAGSAWLAVPSGVTVDQAGNLYFTEIGNNVIRRADRGGMVTTISGTGEPGYSGDGGPASRARIGADADAIVVSREGTLCFGDFWNDAIRCITADGTISTLGSALRSGGLAQDAAGNLYATSTGNQVVRIGRDGTKEIVAGTGQPGYSEMADPLPRRSSMRRPQSPWMRREIYVRGYRKRAHSPHRSPGDGHNDRRKRDRNSRNEQ